MPYVPIEQDPLFQLDRPAANTRCFLLPKEGEPLVECQDRYALDAQHSCYAVADGVAGSFVPGPWARIVAQRFVERAGAFTDQQDFRQWLSACSTEWHEWIDKRWVPTINALRQRNGDGPANWSEEIRKGAQTTLIACTLLPEMGGSYAAYAASTLVNIFAIGDSEFFLFRANMQGGWQLEQAFPFTHPAEFGTRPDTLVTSQRDDLLAWAWTHAKTTMVSAFPGDLLVLATDTLAKWLLTQVQQQNTDRWVPLLSIQDARGI